MTDTQTQEPELKDVWQAPKEESTVLDPELLNKSLIERMPSPTGWRILVLPYKGQGKTEGGLFLPNTVVEEQQVSTQVGYVLKVGDLAYKDEKKFPTGPWCAEKIG